jgi:surface protein
MEGFIQANGGEVVKTVTNKCTHLMSAESGTKKCADAEKKGVVVVDEAWVREQCGGDRVQEMEVEEVEEEEEKDKTLIRTDRDIQEAVDKWCCNSTAAEAKYGHISKWDTSGVTTMPRLFHWRDSFNDDISKWDVGKVTDMEEMLYGCEEFNCDISQWDVSNALSMRNMFRGCGKLSSDLSQWNVSKCTDKRYMFYSCSIPDEHKIEGYVSDLSESESDESDDNDGDNSN